MPPFPLKVPYAEKDEAKGLGARWDNAQRVWFVPDGVDLRPFSRWLPPEPTISVRAKNYFLAATIKRCWKCDDQTQVFGVGVPVGHETLELDDEDEDRYCWYPRDQPSFVYYLTDPIPSVADRLAGLSTYYRIDFSKTTQSSYWMNHCEHCGMKQGDFEMHCEPQGAFFPMSAREASRIAFSVVNEAFGCNGSTSYGDHFLDDMRRA